MIRELYDRDQARMYLDKSVVRLGDSPFLIESCEFQAGGDFAVQGAVLPSHDRCYVNSSSLDDVPFDIGFVNTTHWATAGVCQVLRRSARAWKIGLHKNNTYISSYFFTQGLTPMTWGRLLVSPSFVEAVRGNYPSLSQAYAMCAYRPDNCVAFHRSFYMRHAQELYARDQTMLIYHESSPGEGAVGTYRDNVIVLRPASVYLYEQIQEECDAEVCVG